MSPTADYTPVQKLDRISSIDTLRGFALLGILLMNILGFALPMAAYFNPRVAGGDSGPNIIAWVLQYVLFDGRMRGIFSMVFGAGVYLLITRAEERGAGAGIADIHYRRTLWLMLFGMVHAFFIWWGDILYPYALIALMIYPFRKLSARALLIIAGIQIVLLTGMNVGEGFHLRSMKDEAAKADQAAALGAKLTDEQTEAQKKWKDKLKEMQPPPEEIKKEIDAYRAGYLPALKRRAGEVIKWHSMPYYFPGFWDMMSMMFVGMALVKTRVLTAERSVAFYGKLAAAGYLIGLPINSVAAWMGIQQNFDLLLLPWTFATYQIARVAVTLAHASVLLMLVKTHTLVWLTKRLAAVGQMAFSNYISHSIICSIIFYGYGFGMIGKLERYQLYYIVPMIWIAQLIWSPIWLRYFQFGPLEWCWRSLTYWQRQSMRVRAPLPETKSQEAFPVPDSA